MQTRAFLRKKNIIRNEPKKHETTTSIQNEKWGTQNNNRQKYRTQKKRKPKRRKSAKNEEVAPGKTCKKPKSVKVSILATKMNERMNKTIAKNKVSK